MSHLPRNCIQRLLVTRIIRACVPEKICHPHKSDLRYYCNETMTSAWPKVVCFGDSLTQFGFSKDGCWVANVADHLQRKCDIINRGFSGYNSRWCKLMLPKILTEADANSTQLITIFLGANDSVDSQLCAGQHVPLEEFKQNIMDMVSYLQGIGIRNEKIVIITPPPCVEERWKKHCEATGKNFGKFNKPTKQYADACLEVAKSTGTQVVNLYDPMMKQENWEDMLNDGLHFSSSGSDFVFEQLKPILDKVLGELPMQFPYWADIDNKNPSASLQNFL